MEKYLVIYPDGLTDWIETEHDQLVVTCSNVIGCNFVENVCTIITDVCLIVDEFGKIKDPPQLFNGKASVFYPGWYAGADYIAGPAVVAAIHLVDGELDWVPLNQQELDKVMELVHISFDSCESCPFQIDSAECWGNESCPYNR